MIRTAKAQWQGNLKDGHGKLSLQSGILDDANYSFKTRFEEGVKGTNPEELLGAAHASCFTMSVSYFLDLKGLTANKLDTQATVTIEGTNITKIHLKIVGLVHGINEEEFNEIVKEAEKNCLITKVLSIPISSEAHLET